MRSWRTKFAQPDTSIVLRLAIIVLSFGFVCNAQDGGLFHLHDLEDPMRLLIRRLAKPGNVEEQKTKIPWSPQVSLHMFL